MTSNDRGSSFEAAVFAQLIGLADAHPGFVEVHKQPELRLFEGRICRPDFELVYRTDQEHHELIECQSRNRSSFDIADKIRTAKLLSSRNRFLFVFEDLPNLGGHQRSALENDGVPCLSLGDLSRKLAQINVVVRAMKFSGVGSQAWPDLMLTLLKSSESDIRESLVAYLWESLFPLGDKLSFRPSGSISRGGAGYLPDSRAMEEGRELEGNEDHSLYLHPSLREGRVILALQSLRDRHDAESRPPRFGASKQWSCVTKAA